MSSLLQLNKKNNKPKRTLSLSGDVSLSAAALAANELIVSAPAPLCPVVCSRERSFALLVAVLCLMMFTFYEVGRPSDQSWYPTSMISVSSAEQSACAHTAAALAAHPERDDAYWDEAVKALLDLQAASIGPSQFLKRPLVELPDQSAQLASLRLVVDVVRNCSAALPCNVLVFGVEWDALLLTEVNWRGGQTVFLEDNYHWEAVVRKKVPCMETYGIYYHTRLKDWPYYVEPYNFKELDLLVPHRVITTPWDVIVVRGPAGDTRLLGAFDNPGRMQSLYAAAALARLYFRYPARRDAVDVLVYDFDRVVEKRFAELFLGAANKHAVAGKTAHFRMHKSFETMVKA